MNASELIHNNIRDLDKNNSDENKVPKQNKSTLESVLYPFFENMPPTKKYDSTGIITGIHFNKKFEKEMNKDFIEIENKNITPKWVSFTIEFVNSNKTISKKINFKTEKDELKRFINYYGHIKLDSLLGTKIILKPNYEESEFQDYDVVIPYETATSKLKAKLTKIRSDIAPRYTQPNILSNYIFLSIGRLICSLTILFSIFTYILIFLGGLLIEQEILLDYISSLVLLSIIIFMFNSIILYLSTTLEYKINDYKLNPTNNFLGDIEHSLFIYLKDGFYYAINKLNNINRYIGKRL